MPNLALPTNITPGVTNTFEADVEAAWTEVNRLSRDTGLRDITPALLNGWTASSVRVRRIVDRTYWEFFNLNGSAATSTTLLDVSGMPGFRPAATVESHGLRSTSSTAGYLRVSTSTVTCPIGFVSPGSTIFTFDHRCSAGWPDASTWPGTAV